MGYSKPEAYLELGYIQNSGIFGTRDTFRILGHSEPWRILNRPHTQNLVILRTHTQNYDGALQNQLTAILSFASYYFDQINMIFNVGLIFTPEVLFYVKTYGGQGRGAGDREF